MPTLERLLRQGADGMADWIVFLEGVDPEPLKAAIAELGDLVARGAKDEFAMGLYRLQFVMRRPDSAT